jgi:hypothetical protein
MAMPIARKVEIDAFLRAKIAKPLTQRHPCWPPKPDLHHAMLQEVSGSVRDAGEAEVGIIDCISRSNRAVNRDRTRSSVCGGQASGDSTDSHPCGGGP